MRWQRPEQLARALAWRFTALAQAGF